MGVLYWMPNFDEVSFKFLAEHNADIICRFGLDMMLHYVSPSSVHVLGWTPEEMMDMEQFALLPPEDVPNAIATIERNLSSVTTVPLTTRMRKKDGTLVWVEITACVVRDVVTGVPIESVTTIRDIHERKLLEEKLSALSLTDGLTGLANRRAFDEVLEREWKRTLREGSHMSLLLLDLDHFKQFNDSYGHQIGDDCLRSVAVAILDSVRRATDIVARYGGEEIAVVLPCADSAGALAIAESVLYAISALRIPHQFNAEGEHLVTASIGVATALARQGGTMRMPESLLMSADHALYKAKHEGRNRVAAAFLIASPDVVTV